MIMWFTIAQIAVAVLAAVFCLGTGFAGRRPSDYTVGALALVEVLLVVQVVVAIVAPLTGNAPTGDLLEFWVYLVAAALLPIGAALWALMERSRWSTVILGVTALAIAIMLWRMQVIWTVQVA